MIVEWWRAYRRVARAAATGSHLRQGSFHLRGPPRSLSGERAGTMSGTRASTSGMVAQQQHARKNPKGVVAWGNESGASGKALAAGGGEEAAAQGTGNGTDAHGRREGP